MGLGKGIGRLYTREPISLSLHRRCLFTIMHLFTKPMKFLYWMWALVLCPFLAGAQVIATAVPPTGDRQISQNMVATYNDQITIIAQNRQATGIDPSVGYREGESPSMYGAKRFVVYETATMRHLFNIEGNDAFTGGSESKQAKIRPVITADRVIAFCQIYDKEADKLNLLAMAYDHQGNVVVREKLLASVQGKSSRLGIMEARNINNKVYVIISNQVSKDAMATLHLGITQNLVVEHAIPLEGVTEDLEEGFMKFLGIDDQGRVAGLYTSREKRKKMLSRPKLVKFNEQGRVVSEEELFTEDVQVVRARIAEGKDKMWLTGYFTADLKHHDPDGFFVMTLDKNFATPRMFNTNRFSEAEKKDLFRFGQKNNYFIPPTFYEGQNQHYLSLTERAYIEIRHTVTNGKGQVVSSYVVGYYAVEGNTGVYGFDAEGHRTFSHILKKRSYSMPAEVPTGVSGLVKDDKLYLLTAFQASKKDTLGAVVAEPAGEELLPKRFYLYQFRFGAKGYELGTALTQLSSNSQRKKFWLATYASPGSSKQGMVLLSGRARRFRSKEASFLFYKPA